MPTGVATRRGWVVTSPSRREKGVRLVLEPGETERPERSGCTTLLLALMVLAAVLILLYLGGARLMFVLLGRPVLALGLIGVVVVVVVLARRGAR